MSKSRKGRKTGAEQTKSSRPVPRRIDAAHPSVRSEGSEGLKKSTEPVAVADGIATAEQSSSAGQPREAATVAVKEGLAEQAPTEQTLPEEATAEQTTSEQPAVSEEQLAHRLRTQASQLAEHLRARQREIDHREAQLNARAAELEHGTRAARLWVTERETELQQQADAQTKREAALDAQAETLAKRAESLDATVAELPQRQQELQRRSDELEAKETILEAQRAAVTQDRRELEAECSRADSELARKRQQLNSRRMATEQLVKQMLAGVERRRQAVDQWAERRIRDAVENNPALAQREQQLQAWAEQLENREEELAEMAALLDARRDHLAVSQQQLAQVEAETEQLHQQLTEARRRAEQEAAQQRQDLVLKQRQAMDELQQQREEVQRRGEHVDRCETALKQLRAELGRMHRETLEIRLATEELWVQLAGAAPPAALTQSLGRIRSQLADHYRLASTDLREQKTELSRIRDRLSEQYQRLKHEKERFSQWATQREEEAEQQATRLIAREKSLRESETALQEQAHHWQAERLTYQQELLRLRALVGEQDSLPAAA